MNIKELYRQANIESVERYKKPITEEEFIAAVVNLILIGLAIQIGDEMMKSLWLTLPNDYCAPVIVRPSERKQVDE